MKLEKIKAEWDAVSKEGEISAEDFYEIAIFYMPKLLAVAKAAKQYFENLDAFNRCEIHTYDEEDLRLALEELEKE